ncbi:aromatic amino acid lyase [Dietzia sp. SLG510A3-3B2-2]|jgi:histidine ammonia-lyase|nr:aromatic amino acid lyase [Dietzia sp. SLG510A3-40A3]MBB1010439.1 aromatic amino acid lyase [Dietzia sp. SLG510A3-3B2-2]
MSETRVDSINHAIDSGVADRRWSESLSRIDDQRTMVESALAEGSLERVYGFTTLLGQLDTIETFDRAQNGLLESHLIGRVEEIPGQWLRAMSAVKIEQLSRGGSGISSHTYAELLSRFGEESRERGAWWDSYGCGDVVPGAWWTRSVLGTARTSSLRPGDLIALINGNFVATASLLMAARELNRLVSVRLPRVEVVLDGARGSDRLSHLQVPVTGRPPQHAVALGRSAVSAINSTVEQAVQGFSGNPIFTFEGSVVAKSVSDFLNFEGAVTATSALRTVKILSALVVRAIGRACGRKMEEVEGVSQLRFIQPPKIAAAIYAELSSRSAPVGADLVHQSEGLEDVADGALTSSRALHEALQGLGSLTDLLDAVESGGALALDSGV